MKESACSRPLLDEHLVIKRGENQVSPHLHLPVHKEAPTITAFKGHLLLVTATAALHCDPPLVALLTPDI